MPVTAKIWSGYQWRIGLIALVCLGFGGWAIYDGGVKYPRENMLVDEYEKLPPGTRDDDWPAVALEHGWPTDPRELPQRHLKNDVWTQFAMALITVPLGLLFGFGYVRSRNRAITLDEQGLTTNSGHTVPFDRITRLNKQRWKKGIAVVFYNDGQSEGKLVLDDWKYEQGPMDTIVQELESRLSPDQIIDPTPAAETTEAADEPSPEDAEQDTPREDGPS